MTVNFYLNSKKSRIGDAILYCYVRGLIGKKMININTNIKITPEQWNANKQEVRKNHPDFSQLNSYLSKMRTDIHSFYVEFLINNIMEFEVFKTQLLEKLFSQNKRSQATCVNEVFEKFLTFAKSHNNMSTYYNWKHLYTKLKEFQAYYHTLLYFDDMNIDFFDRFLDYNLYIKRYTNNTAHKRNKQLKTFIRWAAERGYHKNDAYKKVKIREEQVENVHLSYDELMLLFNLDLSCNNLLSGVRDFFCLECFTGQRFSDISALDFNDIKDGYWFLRTKKTKDIIKIPLNRFATSILDKYKTIGVLPKLTNQKTNTYLKELARLAGIDEPIKIVHYRGAERIETIKPKYELVTSHVGRRTFVTLSLEKGMRPEIVMNITGHKDYKTFSKYIKITNSITRQEMLSAWE